MKMTELGVTKCHSIRNAMGLCNHVPRYQFHVAENVGAATASCNLQVESVKSRFEVVG